MNRRETLKTLISASAGLIALPAWAQSWTAADVSTHVASFTLQEQTQIAAIVDTIIPVGDSIGALLVGVDKFLEKLIDNCYEKEVQENVKTQLTALDTSSQTQYNKLFVNCNQAERQILLMKLSTSENKSALEFFNLMKSETIRGFNTSREVMMTYLKYKPVPGHFYGCVDINS